MTWHVLVTYGSRRGSTAEIAEMIAMTLRDDGARVDVAPAGSVRSVAGYDAVVLGGALYRLGWHRDATRFSRRFAGDLADRPVWIFSSGPLDDSARQANMPPVRSVARVQHRLGALDHVTFGGRLDPRAGGSQVRRLVRSGHAGDYRSPERISAWAHGISRQLDEIGAARPA